MYVNAGENLKKIMRSRGSYFPMGRRIGAVDPTTQWDMGRRIRTVDPTTQIWAVDRCHGFYYSMSRWIGFVDPTTQWAGG
jgi:hypothetical protein